MSKVKKGLKYFLIIIGVMVVSVLGLYILTYAGAFGKLPAEKDLRNVQNHVASEIYAADGAILGKYYLENRSQVKLDEMPEHLIHALVATEDARFYNHGGVDTRSLFRVAFKSILLMDKGSGGGSTISQQLAKNLFPRKTYSLFSLPINKFREMITAKRLERVYSKEEILELYLNTVSFGGTDYGIAVASQRFFSKQPAELTIEEAAVLVGMLKATTAYNPKRNPSNAKSRRAVVLDQMVKYDHLEEAVADSLSELDLNLNYQYTASSDGPAPYFRQQIAHELKQWFSANPKEDGTPYNLYTDGLKIYTTIDSRLQKHAELAVQEHMKALQKSFDKHWRGRTLWKKTDPQIIDQMKRTGRYRSLVRQGKSEAEIQKVFETPVKMRVPSWEGEIEREFSPLDSIIYAQSFLHAGFLAMEPQSGHIRAWVGGINHRHFKYDHITSKRQVGSTFKPFVYAAALEEGIDPCEYIPNELVVYEDYEEWAPGNSDDEYDGFYSLQGGLTHSVNTVSATVMMKVGVEKAATFAENMGFTSQLPHEPSLVLGTADLSLLEMVGAYSVFANRGVRVQPMYLLKVEDSEGNVIADFSQDILRKRAMSENTADMMVEMLKTVVDSGTAKRLRGTYRLTSEIGGKTGTTQDQTDGWFMGVTPNLVCGSWVGGDDRKVRFRSLSLGQGANTALPIYGKFMQKVYLDSKYRHTRSSRFPQADTESMENMDCPMFTLDLEDDRKERIEQLIEILIRKQREREGRRSTRRKGNDKWESIFKKKKKQDRVRSGEF